MSDEPGGVVHLPVLLRVGDSEQFEIGEVAAGGPQPVRESLAALLRFVADEIEQPTTSEDDD